MPFAARSFEGIGKNFVGPQGTYSVAGDPPDTNGDIGPNHYVQIVNSSLAVFGRSGAVLFGPVQINTLWRGFGGSCETSTDGDPIVKYDKRADRWIVSQFSVTAPPYLECIAVSATGDPAGSYHRYSYAFPNLNDYPKLGIWPDGYYFTFNMFDAQDNLVGGEVCVFDRTAMLAYCTRLGFAVVSGDPIGDCARFKDLVDDFAAMSSASTRAPEPSWQAFWIPRTPGPGPNADSR